MSEAVDSQHLQPGTRAPLRPLDLVRTLLLIVALGTFVLWGVTGWEFPVNIVLAIATPALALLVWALFVSPRAVVRVHPFVRALIELLVFAAATIAWWSMGQALIGSAIGVLAVATGVVAGRRAFA